MLGPVAKSDDSGAVKSGDRIGDFVLGEVLRQDARGQLFVGEHVSMRKKVHVEVIAKDYLHPDTQLRLAAELQLLAKIRHPTVVHVFDSGETTDGRAYWVMEPLVGQTVAAKLGQGTLRLQELLAILIEVCQGLEAAHAQHLVHGGLCAENLLIVERPRQAPFVKILDFGVARARRGGRLPDRHVDVQALGALFLTQELPPPLAAVLRRARQTDPELRYATVGALREELLRVQRGEAPVQRVDTEETTQSIPLIDLRTPPPDLLLRPTPPPRLPEPRRTGLGIFFGVAIGLVVAAVSFWLLSR